MSEDAHGGELHQTKTVGIEPQTNKPVKVEKVLKSLTEYKRDNVEINGLPIIQDLGEGSAAITFLSYLPDGQSVVVKVGRSPVAETSQQFLEADSLLQKLSTVTPFVPREHGSGRVTINGYERPYYVMDFVDGRTLAEGIKAGDMDLQRKFSVLRGIGYGLDDMLQEGLMPGDLKPENIMLRRGTNVPVHIDLEHMNKVGEPFHKEFFTPHYSGPDRFFPRRELGPGAITWSYTAIAYEMLTGKSIFNTHSNDTAIYFYNNENAYNKYLQNELQNSDLPVEAQQIFLRGFSYNPEERFQTNSEIARALQDVYIPNARKTKRQQPRRAASEHEKVHKDSRGPGRIKSLLSRPGVRTERTKTPV
ncbi:MAG TPA: hypothetical protein VND99_05540 [Candidatus Acidoferrales bacterium]|nr:hypothetical protein [Candidatus Acidoferrales bacterium]